MSMTRYMENEIITSYLVDAPYHIALYTTDPGELGAGSEVVGIGYARVACTFEAVTMAAGKKYASNVSDIIFTEAGSSWGTVAYIGLIEDTTSEMLWYSSIANPQAIGLNDQLVFLAGSIQITLE